MKPTFQIQQTRLLLSHDGQSLPVSLMSPRFVFGEGIEVVPTAPLATTGVPDGPDGMTLTYAPIPLGETTGTLNVVMHLTWDRVDRALRKWASYQPQGDFNTIAIRQIDLETIDTAGRHLDFQGQPVQSYPAFIDGFFVGVEFPVATTRLEGDQLIISQWPGRVMKAGESRETRKAIYGLAPVGGERPRFKDYIASHRPRPHGLHYSYNSWWTSSVPFSEEDILKIFGFFRDNLIKPYGIGFDSFNITMGWSKKDGLWEIDEKMFPDGFTKLARTTHVAGVDLGVWISPTNFYSPGSFDNEWANDQGYETMVIDWGGNRVRLCKLAGPRYATAFRERLLDMIRRYDIRQVMLDGYYLQDPDGGPGYEAGLYSTEAMAEGGLAAFTAMREAQPDIWLQATCFGFHPSPWWLFYVNSVIGTYGDDSPHGRVPCPVYRESYTTTRDYYNLQGAARLPIPINGQEVLGITHQTNEPFLNDGVVTLLRGNAFNALFINPKYLDARRWGMLAALLRWGKTNEATLLAQTTPLEPAAWQAEDAVPELTGDAKMPRQPYGYAHFNGDRSLIMLRNPWIAPQSYRLTLDESLGMPAGRKGLNAVSLYPQVRLYKEGISSGDTLDVPLAPYETVVLTLTPDLTQSMKNESGMRVEKWLKVDDLKTTLTRVEFPKDREDYGPDWTCLMPGETSACRIQIQCRISGVATSASLLVLAEGDGVDPDLLPIGLTVDGKPAKTLTHNSMAGWTATGIPQKEFWTFLEAPMSSRIIPAHLNGSWPDKDGLAYLDTVDGRHTISLDVYAASKSKSLSVWVWGYDDVNENKVDEYPNSLPAPERISRDALALIEPFDPSAAMAAVQAEPPVERIEGVYLDSLTPESSSQGWGELQRNRSVWEKPLIIAGRHFRRGLGISSDSQITYRLTPGQYRRFQAWVGADNATTPSVVFEVWLDGKKVWESGLMTQPDPARRVDLDISGVQTLQLCVGDGGNGITGDHADWADAMLVP